MDLAFVSRQNRRVRDLWALGVQKMQAHPALQYFLSRYLQSPSLIWCQSKAINPVER
jgi:hypothetical protein